MKTISPVVFPLGLGVAKILNSYVINDNLLTSATFWYGLMSETPEGNVGTQLNQGNLTMTGEDYAAYQTNNYAWDWVAAQLDVTITGEYVPPVPAPIVEEQTINEAPVETPIEVVDNIPTII